MTVPSLKISELNVIMILIYTIARHKHFRVIGTTSKNGHLKNNLEKSEQSNSSGNETMIMRLKVDRKRCQTCEKNTQMIMNFEVSEKYQEPLGLISHCEAECTNRENSVSNGEKN